MHPGDAPGSGVVRSVSHVHAPSTSQNDGPGTCGLRHQFHDLRRLAALTGAVAGRVVLLVWNLLYSFDSLEYFLGHRFHVWYGHFAATQSADEAQYWRSGSAVAVHGGPNFGRHYATQVRRTERDVAIEYANGLEALQALANFLTGKRTEPA